MKTNNIQSKHTPGIPRGSQRGPAGKWSENIKGIHHSNFKQPRTRQGDSHLPDGKRVRFNEQNEIFYTLPKGTLDKHFENVRLSNDFFDRHILRSAAQTKYPEGSEEQLTAIRTALTSPVSQDIYVLKNTLDTLENNLTNPYAKRRYIDLLSTNPQLRPHSIFWDPYKEKIVEIDLKPRH